MGKASGRKAFDFRLPPGNGPLLSFKPATFKANLSSNDATGNGNAKPEGAMGCEIWVKVGSAPADPSELHFLGLDTRTPCTAEYGGEDAGKTAHYMLRWVNSKGEQGPWSQTVSATITG